MIKRTSNPLPLPRALSTALLGTVLAALGAGAATATPQQTRGGGRTALTSSPPVPKTGTVVDAVAETLAALGVDTSATPRKDEQNQDLDDGYAPLGGGIELNRIDELVLVGLDLQGDDYQRSFFVYQDGTAGALSFGSYDPDILHDMGANEMEDHLPATAAGSTPQSYRAVAAADIDRDGQQEILVLHHNGTELRLRVIEDQGEGFATTEQVLAVDPLISDVAIVGADFDGDGKAEIAAAWAVDGLQVTIALLDETPSGFQIVYSQDIMPAVVGSEFSLVLEKGNVDNDYLEEIVLVVNENAVPEGLCRWFLHDDATTGWAPIGGGSFTSSDQGVERTAVVGDVALGDIDGDGRDEVLLAGLTAFTTGCVQPDYIVLALDDAEHGLAELGTRHFHHDYTTVCSGGPKMVRWAHINTGDFDGDGRHEIQMNQWIYDDWIDGGTWTEKWSLPGSVVMSGGSWQYFDRSTSAFAVGDYTGDGLDNILTVRSGIHNVQVYGLDTAATDPQFVNEGHIWCESYSASSYFANPLLLTVNVDDDTAVLTYSEGTYQFAFTEPVVIAALAAPPFQNGIAQNYGACSTAFGNTTSTGSEAERSVSLSAGVSVGVNIDGGVLTQSEFELSASLSVEATRTSGHSYQLDKTVIFQSGYNEDLVVFTAIPMDIYTYRVLSHSNPAMVGEEVVLRYPRSPVIIQADREYYNAHIFEGGMVVGDDVFQHTIGELSTYPSVASKNQLLGLHGGLQNGPISVGIGTGQTQAIIQVGESWSSGGALEVSYELEVKATGATVMAGFTVGGSTSDSLTITSGQQTTYIGTVGAIEGFDYPANAYQFGLFTYVLPEPSGRYEFEVLNYWVE